MRGIIQICPETLQLKIWSGLAINISQTKSGLFPVHLRIVQLATHLRCAPDIKAYWLLCAKAVLMLFWLRHLIGYHALRKILPPYSKSFVLSKPRLLLL